MDEKNEEQTEKQKEDPVVANKWQYFFEIWFLGNFRVVLDKMEVWQQQAQTIEDIKNEKGKVDSKEMKEGKVEKRESNVTNLSRKKCVFKKSYGFLRKKVNREKREVEINKKVEEVMYKKDEAAVAITEDLKKYAVLRSLLRKYLSSSIMSLKSSNKWKRLGWKIVRTKSWRRLGQLDVLDG